MAKKEVRKKFERIDPYDLPPGIRTLEELKKQYSAALDKISELSRYIEQTDGRECPSCGEKSIVPITHLDVEEGVFWLWHAVHDHKYEALMCSYCRSFVATRESNEEWFFG